jgi:hypothetical protein
LKCWSKVGDSVPAEQSLITLSRTSAWKSPPTAGWWESISVKLMKSAPVTWIFAQWSGDDATGVSD